MADALDVLADGFGRVRNSAHSVVDGLDEDALTFRVDADANSIGWLIWHLARVQDDHVAGVAGSAQVWTSAGWAGRFALPFEDGDIGYGQHPREVAAVRTTAEVLLGYLDAVIERTLAYLRTLDESDLDRVVDTAWDPPVTLLVRLISVLNDDLQHVGQAAFVRGVLDRRS